MNSSYKMISCSHNDNANNNARSNDAMIMVFLKPYMCSSKLDKLWIIKEKRKSLDVTRNFLNFIEIRFAWTFAHSFFIWARNKKEKIDGY